MEGIVQIESSSSAYKFWQTISKVTTCEKKNGLLLIEVFSKLFNTQNYGNQGSILGGLFYNAGAVRILHFGQFHTRKTMREDKQETLFFDLDSWTRIIGNILFV